MALALGLLLGVSALAAAANGSYNLADFGPVQTAAEAQATLTNAITNIIAHGGGLLVVAPGVNADWVIENDAPSSTQRGTNTVTILDRRRGYESLALPANGQAQGMTWASRHLTRTVRAPIDMAFGVHSTEAIDTSIVGGTTSYDQFCLSALKAGAAQRVYVPTIRGLAVGWRIVISGRAMGYGEPYDRVVVKELGWDREKKLAYFVADLQHDHPARALAYDKHVVNSLSVTDHSNSDNQSMGLMVSRQNYGIGDSFVIAAHAVSQGNIMSGGGDEGGLCYGADISNDLRPFRSTVESIKWPAGELVYAPGMTRNFTLGTSRPLINLNTNKWVTQGVVYYVGPGHADPWHPDKILVEGAVIGAKDCGWTREIIGRFFAFDEPSEYLDPQIDHDAGYTAAPDRRVYRWYQIHKLEAHADGTQRIWLERTRWFVQYYAPTLYDNSWFSYAPAGGQSRLKPMHYLIAPGAYVADVSQAWTDSENSGGYVYPGSPRTLKLAPTGDVGTTFDFAPGDPVVQAIGQDPWNVTGLRVRHHGYLPSTLPDSSLQAMNLGRVAVSSALSIGGGDGDLTNDVRYLKSRSARFGKAIDIGGTANVGIRFGADVATAALVFEQPHGREQPLWWYGQRGLAASLSVDPQTGDFTLRGGPVRTAGLVVGPQGGLSGSATPAHNLRGIGVPVNKGATEWPVPFARPETDAAYALTVQPSWLTASAVVAKTPQGFTVRFAQPAPRAAKLDWLLVR